MNHPIENHDITYLVSRMSISVKNFSCLLTSQTGTTPAKYVEMVRIDAAQHYLLSVKTLVEKVGFFALS